MAALAAAAYLVGAAIRFNVAMPNRFSQSRPTVEASASRIRYSPPG